jgi:PEGA domain
MEIRSEPGYGHGGGRRGLVIGLGATVSVVVIAGGLWLFSRQPAEGPKAPSGAPRARSSPSPRATPALPAAPEAGARPRPRAEPGPATKAPALRVDADVPGANVFLDHKFLGTTPVETRDFAPGPHRLNVSAEGYEMYDETIELADESRDVVIRFKEVRLDERVDVVHKHGVGSYRGRLLATTTGLRYEADRAGDSFSAPFANLEPLQLDYLSRNLRVKQRGGKTWNFTAESADALLAFQKAVEAARKRIEGGHE